MRTLTTLRSARTTAALVLVLCAYCAELLSGPLQISFDEFGPTPANGLSFRWVDFRFEIGEQPSNAANFGARGPGNLVFVQDPCLEGPLNGVITFLFPWPTSRFEFGVAQNRTAPAQEAVVTELFDETGESIESTPVAIAEQENRIWAEAKFEYSDPKRPVSRAQVRFDRTAGQRFALDNLAYDSPCADFSATPSTGEAPLEIEFTAQAEDECGVVAFAWDFGDGNSAEGRTVTNTFTEPGRYQVTLELRHTDGWAAATTGFVNVTCPSEDIAPWSTSEVGGSHFPSSASVDGDCVRVCSGGSGLGLETDSLFFVHQELRSDGSVTAQIAGIGDSEDRSRIGLMVRSSLEPDASYAALAIEGRGEGFNFRRSCREFNGDPQECDFVNVPTSPPNGGIHAVRRGPLMVVSRSSDGQRWTEVDAFIVDLGETALFGIFSTAADRDSTAHLRPVNARVCQIAVEGERVEQEVAPMFRRGDSNADGNSNLTDAVFVLSYLFSQGPAPSCLEAADVDDAGDVTLTDAIQLLVFLFQQGAPPPPPTDACGEDPTADELGCEEFAPCS